MIAKSFQGYADALTQSRWVEFTKGIDSRVRDKLAKDEDIDGQHDEGFDKHEEDVGMQTALCELNVGRFVPSESLRYQYPRTVAMAEQSMSTAQAEAAVGREEVVAEKVEELWHQVQAWWGRFGEEMVRCSADDGGGGGEGGKGRGTGSEGRLRVLTPEDDLLVLLRHARSQSDAETFEAAVMQAWSTAPSKLVAATDSGDREGGADDGNHVLSRLQALMDEGVAKIQSGDLSDARGAFSEILQAGASKEEAGGEDGLGAGAEWAEAWNKRATVLFMQAKKLDADCPLLAQSLEDIEKVLELQPSHFGALSGKGMCHNQRMEYEEAARVYEKVLEVHPWQASALHSLNSANAAIADENAAKNADDEVVSAMLLDEEEAPSSTRE
jgi:tetratricopeptide (TPR) repeat protein